ncbi:hypothetical protein Q5752_001747 [Cryptotrichosporon argae]
MAPPTNGSLFGAAGSPFGTSASSSPFSFVPSAPKTSTPLQSFTAPSTSAGSTTTTTEQPVLGGDDDDDADTLHLKPAAFSKADKAKWKASGRTVLAAVSPVGGEVAAWITSKPSAAEPPAQPTGSKLPIPDRTIFFASPNSFPKAVQDLYAETYTLFISLQRIVASAIRLPADGRAAEAWDRDGNLISIDGLLGPPGAETVVHMRRLVEMYLDELAKLREAEIEDDLRVKFETVYHVFSLAEILYLPQDGRGEGLLGEELLDWVNAVDTIHINDQGNEIMQSKDPWSHPLFWPFINRCLLRGFFLPASSFLRTLSTHPHTPIAKLGLLLATHVSVLPRSTNTASYSLDHQFLSAHKMWLARLRAELAGHVGGKDRGKWLDDGTGGDWKAWEDDFRAVVELMEGKSERVLEESADWREAVGAWGVLVDVGLRRDDLPAAVGRILDQIPIDSTVLEDTIESALCSGDIVKTLMGCHDLDIWLAAHLGDVFDKLALIPDDEERFDTSLRDYFLLEYTDLLSEFPNHAGLWRVIAEYLAAAGDEGRNRLKTYIVHVGLEGTAYEDGAVTNGDGMEVEDGPAEKRSGVDAQFRHFTELRETCVELRLENEWRTISSGMADRLIRREQFGLAASMCMSAEDGHTLSRIADKIVDAYIDKGDETFLNLVDTLPAVMLAEAPAALTKLQLGPDADNSAAAATMVLFASRLACLSELRDHLLFAAQDAAAPAAAKLVNLLTSGIAPPALWAVLLALAVPPLEADDILFTANDTFELMRVLEDVLANAAFAEDDYLGLLTRCLARQGEKDGAQAARRRLDEVRLALARNLARALVDGFDHPF